MPVPWRRRVVLLATVAYVAVLAVWADGAREPRGFLFGAAALGLGFAASRRASPVERALGWGAAVVLASLGAKSEHRGLDGCGAVGAMASVVAAVVAIARIPGAGGIAPERALSPVVSMVIVALAWWTALVARYVPDRWTAGNPAALEIASVAVSALMMLAVTDWTLRRRGLELGVEERARAMRALLAVCLAAAVVVGVLNPAQMAPVGRAFVAGASVALGLAALYPDPVRVARFTRRAIVLAGVGGALALMGASAAAGGRGDAGAATFATALAALAIGACAPLLDAPLRPVGGLWLEACARASECASDGEPEAALRDVLVALRAPGGAASRSPELWTLEPPRVAVVDAAGYLHERDGGLPEALLRVAPGEPEATVRADLVDSLQVRRPDLRALSKWMSDRGVWLATLIGSDGEVDGALVLPRVGPDRSPTLEEVRAFKAVADRLAGPCRARATQARLLGRVHETLLRAEAAEEEVARLVHERALDVGRNAIAVARFAREADFGVYAASSRMALEAIERRTAVGAPVAVVAPSGVDPVPYLARAHLSGARREGPFVIVDATSGSEHDVARWKDARSSPLALAERGTLVLLDGAVLPAEIQQLVARALAERRAPWERAEPVDVHLAFTAVVPPNELVARGRLDPSLASRLGDAASCPVALPRLRDRPEDLRAIFTDRLAREGLRIHGRPVGIEHAAYARFVDHPFAGEDAELVVIARRLVARCQGDVVRAAEVDFLVPPEPADGRVGRPTASADDLPNERSGRKGSRRGTPSGQTKGSGRDA